MKKSVFSTFFQAAAFIALGLSFASCNDAHEFPREDFPKKGEIWRDVTIGNTVKLEIGDYSCSDTYIGEVSPADGTPQVFTPLHTGNCMVISPNHDMAVYRFFVAGTVAPFDGIDLSWGISFDDMLEKLGLKFDEDDNDVNHDNGIFKEENKIEITAGGKLFTYLFPNGVLSHVTVGFNLKTIAQEMLTGEEVLLTYLTENFNFTEGENGFYGRYFNQATLEKATTVIEIVDYPEDETPAEGEDDEKKPSYELLANFYDAKTVNQ